MVSSVLDKCHTGDSHDDQSPPIMCSLLGACLDFAVPSSEVHRPTDRPTYSTWLVGCSGLEQSHRKLLNPSEIYHCPNWHSGSRCCFTAIANDSLAAHETAYCWNTAREDGAALPLVGRLITLPPSQVVCVPLMEGWSRCMKEGSWDWAVSHI